MGLLLKQAYDQSPYFNPILNPFFIKKGEMSLPYEGFIFSLQEGFGDQKFFDLENYTIKFKMYDEADTLSAFGVFDLIEENRSKISYQFKPFDTKRTGNYYVLLEFAYDRPSALEVLPESSFTIDFVSSFISYSYGVGNFKVEFEGVNLISLYDLDIDVNDTKDIIASKINTAINNETISHGFSSSVLNNKLTLTGPTGSGASLNNKSLIITCDDKIVIGNDLPFQNGKDPVSALQFNYTYPNNKNILRIIIK